MNVAAKTRRFFSKCRLELGLWTLGVLVALTLCGADAVQDDLKSMLTPDHYSHTKLVESAVSALERGQFPIRVAENLNGDLGHPYHQFYSPAVHTVMAGFVFIFGNLFTGMAYSIVFMMALAFVYSHKLCRYLTSSRIWGLVGAFLFVCGPYLSINRVLRGAFAEYFAMCLIPLLAYWQLRALARVSAGRWAAAVMAWVLMVHSHMITTTFLIFFAIVFWGLHGLFVFNLGGAIKKRLNREYLTRTRSWLMVGVAMVLVCFCYMWPTIFLPVLFFTIVFHLLHRLFVSSSGRSKNNRLQHKYLVRTGTWVAVGAGMVLVSAWYLWPAVFYHDLMMKASFILPAHIYFQEVTAVMSLFGLTDIMWATTDTANSGRFQVGLLLLAGFFSFIYLRWRETSSTFIWPLWLVSALALFMVISPLNVLSVKPLTYIDIAQFTYRYLAQLQLFCVILSVLALKALAEKNSWLSRPFKFSVALTVIASAMILVTPYLYPATFFPSYPAIVTKKDVRDQDTMMYMYYAYFRAYYYSVPVDIAPTHWIKAQTVTNTADRLFVTDLAEWSQTPQWPGRLVFDVLYYPGLQLIETKLDGREIQPTLDTYGSRRGDIPRFHALELSDLPNTGELSVRVRFVGSRIGNRLSLAGLALVLAAVGWSIRSRRPKTAPVT